MVFNQEVHTHVLRRMAVAHYGTPFSATNLNILTISNASITSRQRGDVRTKLSESLPIAIKPLLRETRSMIKTDRIRWHVTWTIGRHYLAHVKVTATHPKFAIPLLGDPPGIAGEVRVKVRREHEREGCTFRILVEDGLLSLLNVVPEKTSVDYGPTFTVSK